MPPTPSNPADVARLAVPLLKRLEGLRLQAYPDPATGGDPWTIGYGATGPEIRKGVVWTRAQADADLERRCVELAAQVAELLTVPLSDRSRAALVSFAYNVGIGAFKKSTLLRRLNAGDMQGAAAQFAVWNKAAGKVFPGLVKRRVVERDAFVAELS